MFSRRNKVPCEEKGFPKLKVFPLLCRSFTLKLLIGFRINDLFLINVFTQPVFEYILTNKLSIMCRYNILNDCLTGDFSHLNPLTRFSQLPWILHIPLLQDHLCLHPLDLSNVLLYKKKLGLMVYSASDRSYKLNFDIIFFEKPHMKILIERNVQSNQVDKTIC